MPTPLTPETISAMRPGPELDHHVHILVLGLPEENRSDLPCYSETTAALTVLGAVPIEVGRFSDNDPEFNRDRPYYGRFTVGPIQDPKTYVMRCASPELALCKTALLYRWATRTT